MVKICCKTIDSSVLGRSISVRFIIPEGENLPCLFLLHGYDGNQDEWYEKSNIVRVAAEYNLVVVMPGCGNGYYEDTHEDMPRFLGDELLAYVRGELPVSDLPEKTYIAGVSMGGFGAILVGSKYNHAFGKMASLSGAFIIHDIAIGNPGVLRNADVNYFRSVFGDFSSLEGSSRDPIAEAVRTAKADPLPKICILCGENDILYEANKEAVHDLVKNEIPVVWYSVSGNHSWSLWNDMMPHVVRWLIDGISTKE